MNNDDEDVFLIAPENLTKVLSDFLKIFKGNPLLVMSMDEIIEIFSKDFPITEEGTHEITDSGMKKFLDKINGIQVDRIFHEMDRKGLATLGHDGTDICLIRKDS